MFIAIPKEASIKENRIPVLPPEVEKLVKLGATVLVEKGLGQSIQLQDKDYLDVKAEVLSDRQELLGKGDLVLRLRKPEIKEISCLKKGALHISFLDPFFSGNLLRELARCEISAISMELIPRITRAQKMDALSSQANLAGYVSVILAAERLNKIFPMMMTPAGTISPARVFIIGVGVAGLQAIATAKRLGARVEAFDTRPVVEEQVRSLGAKFVKVDLGETGETKDGYAKALTDEQMEKQRQMMAKHCAMADVVITTAQVFGRKAPLIVTKEMVKQMKPGSLLVDLAVESGGNIEGSVLDEEVNIEGVRILGLGNLPGQAAFH